MTVLSIDFETRSAVDLRKAGAHRYAEDPSTDIWCLCWAFDDEPVQTWRPGEPIPDRIFDHVFEGGLISGWNVGFERAIWNGVLGPRYGWPCPRLEQFEDTAAAGAAMGLPRNLGDAAKAMGTAFQKDDEGHRLMLRMAKPRRPRKGETPTGLLWWDEPDRIARLIAYCVDDVETERALRKVLVPLAPEERETWLFDQRMNDRGALLDLPLIHALQKIAVEATADLDTELEEVSGVEKTTQVARLSAWINEAGVECTSLAKGEIERMLAIPDLPNSVRAALEIRRDGAKTSTKKLKAMLACVSRDGRGRGQHLYHGAGTGRWSGRLIQVQNFPRGTGTVKDPEAAVADFMRGDADWIRIGYGKPMNAVADMLRSCMMAAKGKRLLAADFSAIEGRVTAWLAGEAWKIKAFEANDAGTGPGIYELTAAGILSKAVEAIGKAERQAYGKVPELALGFQGGVQAFDSMAKIYRVDMAEAYEPLAANTDAKTWARALKRYEECLERNDTGTDTMTREAWIASEVTKVLWRDKHPATKALWEGLEEAAFDAIRALRGPRHGELRPGGGARLHARRDARL
jgi:DNA polymerase